MWTWIAKKTIPWLIEQAMKQGAKRFTEHDASTHGFLTRNYLYDHIGKKLKTTAGATKNELDDRIVQYADACLSWPLCDGSAFVIWDMTLSAVRKGDFDAAETFLEDLREFLEIMPCESR